MPSSTRQTISSAVKGLRQLEEATADRRCDHLLMVKASQALVLSSESLDHGIASLDEALASRITDEARAAIAALGRLDLHGVAPGVDGITDEVGRLISLRQLPSVYRIHLLAAAIIGVEHGLRDLLPGSSVDPAPRPAVTKPAKATKRRPPASPDEAVDRTPAAPVASMPPIPDMAAVDLLDRLSPAPAPVSGPSSGRLDILSDTERI